MKWSKASSITVIIGLCIIIAATAFEKGLGTYCSICPVGFLQVTAASRSIPTNMILGTLIGLVLIFFIGRFFCAWLCPSLLIKSDKASHKTYISSPWYLKYLPYLILVIAVVISFIVQFPIFCLICPIGLIFGFLFAIFKLFHIYEPSWNLLIFPAILAIELLLFRRWCKYICPIAGIFTLVRKIPLPKLLLKVNKNKCLSFQNKNCHVCTNNCAEGLEITKSDKSFIERCTLCTKCKDNCPTKSIGFKEKNITR